MPTDPFHLDLPHNHATLRAAAAAARPFLSWFLRLPTYRMLYAEARNGLPRETSFLERALEVLDICVDTRPGDLDRIPRRGPLVAVANHPHGLLDGLVLASLIARVRPDARIVTNFLLSRIPELSASCFFVDPWGGPAAAARSRAGLRAAHVWLREGGALVMFPAGEVAHRPCAGASRLDSPWRDTAVRLAHATAAALMPAFIEGGNSRIFYAAGRIHPALRTALLARELLKKRGSRVSVRLGGARSIDQWIHADDQDRIGAATSSLRQAVAALRNDPVSATTSTPVVPPVAADDLDREIRAFPETACLIDGDPFQVFCAPGASLDAVLREIGRLRELTYRAVGEGTGRAIDLDAFDRHYLHLFSWDRRQRTIVGAYRIGRTDHRVHALYTRTLFNYDDRLLGRLGPALELGRSFVRGEYQRNYGALLLLWKGIGQFVARNPEYRVLFGPVSVSTRYSSTSHQLLMAFLEQNHYDGELATLVSATNAPTKTRSASLPLLQSIEDVDRAIMRLEHDRKGMPILLRQYLKLNARVLGFNVDPAFGDVLDALMMVDLTRVDRAILNRYLGRDEAARFLEYHHSRAVCAA